MPTAVEKDLRVWTARTSLECPTHPRQKASGGESRNTKERPGMALRFETEGEEEEESKK